ncbi:MAG: aminotransferase class I/II-fold pyridoxal phosphate-dependent enzyme [Eubacteriales bacterium]
MKYDFTTMLDRSGKDSIAFDIPDDKNFIDVKPTKEGFDRIPMWVADMNFMTVPTIVEKMTERVSCPIYGYFRPTKEYFDKIIKWHSVRNGMMEIEPECIGYENSVLGGLMSALGVLCSAGEKVLVHSPTYVGFTGSLRNAGYEIVHSALVLDEENVWRMDFDNMEEILRTQNIHTAIFCNPHNPCGRAWEKWELEKVMELYKKYDVSVVSDEIWSDIILEGSKHIPLQSISEDAKNRTVALYAPSKTFNLAGLIGSYHIIYNKALRDRIRKYASLGHYNSLNVLSMHALLGAYEPEGYEWVDELCAVITKNINYAYDFFTKQVSGVTVSKPQATYMLFIDCTKWLEEHNKTFDELMDAGYEYGIIWQDGRNFHGANCLRINFALPFEKVKEAIDRLDKYVFNGE